MYAVKLRQHGNSYAITIPAPYLKQLHWGLGDLLLLEVAGHELHVNALQPLLGPRPAPPTHITEDPNATPPA